MKYISTRGGITPISFTDAVMMGLATDGGLLVPESLPRLARTDYNDWQESFNCGRLTFQELAHRILSRFISDLPADDLRQLIESSYHSFSHPAITPLVRVGDLHIMELFHGPTLAFKDIALQFLGNIFSYILQKTGGKMNILGATSGDTGSAAIYGVRGKDRINIFILHPHKRVSPIQELQMTTVLDDNVFNLAVDGTFDDGQAIVKQIFTDIPFKAQFHLGAINSINWARILSQVVYYVYAALEITRETGATAVDFSVPTGNFGDIFAGYIARELLPPGTIDRLILATNENNLLTRFVLDGDYSLGSVVPTTSPSMDIQVASNFERYLFYLRGRDAARTKTDMESFAREGRLDFSRAEQGTIRQVFSSKSVTRAETAATIRSTFTAHGYILDPHTAVGVNAALACRAGNPVVCLATAHPAKFGEAVREAIGRDPEMPPALAGLADKESRCFKIEAAVAPVKSFIEQHAI